MNKISVLLRSITVSLNCLRWVFRWAAHDDVLARNYQSGALRCLTRTYLQSLQPKLGKIDQRFCWVRNFTTTLWWKLIHKSHERFHDLICTPHICVSFFRIDPEPAPSRQHHWSQAMLLQAKDFAGRTSLMGQELYFPNNTIEDIATSFKQWGIPLQTRDWVGLFAKLGGLIFQLGGVASNISKL